MLHIINIVHTEPNWWDGQYTGLDIGATHFLDRLEALCLRVPVTWCAYFGNGHRVPGNGQEAPDLIDARPGFIASRARLGDETGIHVHGRAIFHTDPFIARNAAQLQVAGYPYPSTHAPYWNRLDPSMLHALVEAGIAIDTSLVPRIGKSIFDQDYDEEARGRVLQDCSWRDPDDPASYRPYHPSYEDVSREGDCPVLEIPITFSYHGIEDHVPWYLSELRRRKEALLPTGVDVVQFFWHPHEFLYPWSEKINFPVIEAFCRLFSEIAGWDGVVFSTARDAARAYERKRLRMQ